MAVWLLWFVLELKKGDARRMILDDISNKRSEIIGLLSLWIGTGEWGVSEIPKEKGKSEHRRIDYTNRLKPTRRILRLYEYVINNDVKKRVSCVG